MLPNFLIPECAVEKNGHGAALPLGDAQGQVLQLTLAVRRAIEQESLDVWIEGSADGQTWLEKPLAQFPQKFYCGDYAIVCDLAAHPEVTMVRAAWKVHRWGRGEAKPFFEIALFAEASGNLALAAGR
jgi:hypothetical protein